MDNLWSYVVADVCTVDLFQVFVENVVFQPKGHDDLRSTHESLQRRYKTARLWLQVMVSDEY